MSIPTDWLVVAGLSLATLVRATFGFGEALVAVPLLAFVLPVEIAAPVATLISITVAAIVVVQDWQHVDARAAARLVAWSMLGIPLGLLLLRTVPEGIVKGALGLVVALFAASSLAGREGPALENDRWAWLFGTSAGVLGGAYGMNGPPLVVYGSLRRWTPGRFRATLQGYFLPASLAGMAGYWAAGLWTARVNGYYLLALPAVLITTALGGWLSRRIDAARFRAYVYAGLVVIGCALLLQAIV